MKPIFQFHKLLQEMGINPECDLVARKRTLRLYQEKSKVYR